jgi:phosphoribosylformylglycinamidine synthase
MPAMTDVKITKELIERHGLTPEEYERIKGLLGREPNLTELGMFSVMWSEHCSYKNSKPVLKLLIDTGNIGKDRGGLLVKAGDENAGVIDIGDGYAIVFKMESHNHPSAIEPFQGAATGVGGILRDIFTMGARPVLLMDSLRFGPVDSPVVRRLVRGVVAGISHYGNCMGVPTVGGEVYFDEAYDGNPLVNVFCLGIVKNNELVKGHAAGTGNPVYYVGATTGRDGLGGASFASREITESSEEDRPAVQAGDPFLEKLLLEACLELIREDAIVGLQDMGAAGLSCATSEMASRGGVGMDVDVQKVPRRETGMVPYEVMLSESQERMLLVVKKGREAAVEKIFEKWDLHAVKIGEVTEGPNVRIFDGPELAAEIGAKALASEAPVYIREEAEPAYLREVQSFDPLSVEVPNDYHLFLKKLLSHPTIASKEWIYEKYDHMVRTDSVFLPGHDAALIRVKGTKKALAVSTDCNGLYCYLDPYEGGKIAVAEAARNVVASGAVPLGLTDCLNFGNPMKPEVFWQFHRAVEGIRDACLALQVPVTGGNVSFYNENPEGAIYPTPTIGMAGLLDDLETRIPTYFQADGDIIFLLGETRNELGGSHYLLTMGIKKGLPPRLDFEKEKKLYQFIWEANRRRLLKSCHDLSEGGLAVALFESALGCGRRVAGAKERFIGVEADGFEWVPASLRPDSLLFGETQSRAIVSVDPSSVAELSRLAEELGLPAARIGAVHGRRLKIGSWIDLEMEELAGLYSRSLREKLETI